jgi:hypothetical protein
VSARQGLVPCNFIEALDESEEAAVEEAAQAKAETAAAEEAGGKKKGLIKSLRNKFGGK